MNPLSAIRQMLPGLPPLASGRPDRATPTRAAIPLSELQDLSPAATPPSLSGAPNPGSGFSDLLGRMISEVSAKQAAAGQAVQDLQSGQNVSLHQTMIALEEASVSFQLMVEVRNKLLESYQELMRMQV